jgi:hypothetical protein
LPTDVPMPYIGPFSGRSANLASNLHFYHVSFYGNTSTTCFRCHADATVAVGGRHFSNITSGRRRLATGFAASTITGTGIVSYSPSAGCVTTCHVIAPPDPRPWH